MPEISNGKQQRKKVFAVMHMRREKWTAGKILKVETIRVLEEYVSLQLASTYPGLSDRRPLNMETDNQ